MARFNQTTRNVPNPRKTVNHEGAPAYLQPTPEVNLYVATATSLLSSKFYEPAPTKPVKDRYGRYSRGVDQGAEMKQSVTGIIKIAEQVKSPTFIANLAIYLRNEMYLRSVSNLLVAYLALKQQLDRRVVPLVARRADDVKELVAMYRYLKSGADAREIPVMPNQLKKGGAETLRFKYDGERKRPRDAYEFRKYNKGGKEDITFLDLLRLFHPAPVNAEQANVFKMIKEGNLPVIDTWETLVSAAGPDAAKKRAAWEKVIDDGMNYMAALRNLRNILQAGVSPAHIRKVIELLQNAEAVQKSMQLPFRFLSAYRELERAVREGSIGQIVNVRGIMDAIETAMSISTQNFPGFERLREMRIATVSDKSGSMTHPVHGMSSVNCMDIAMVLGAALASNLDAVTLGVFADDYATVLPGSRILATAQDMLRQNVGGGTNGALVLQRMREKGIFADMVVFFTDCQIWNEMDRYYGGSARHGSFEQEWNAYRSQINPRARLTIFNLAGYNTVPIDVVRPDVLQIAGWSDKIFRVLADLEKGENFFARFHQPILGR